MQVQRLHYIDALRGIAIISVVYNHVLSFGLHEVIPSKVSELSSSVQMPLFFFICGFVAYHSNFDWNIKSFFSQLGKKALQILIPSFVMMGIFVMVKERDFIDVLFNSMKLGYWFTFVYFEVFAIFAIMNTLFFLFINKEKHRVASIIYPIVVWLIPTVVMWLMYRQLDFFSSWGELFSAIFIKMYYSWFVLGCFCRKYVQYLNLIAENKYMQIIFFFLGIIIPMTSMQFPESLITFSLIFLLYSVFFMNRKAFTEESRLGSQLAYLGRFTLEIYFLHFFMLFNIPSLSRLLVSCSVGTSFGGASNPWLLELFVIGTIALIMCYTCIWINKVLSSSSLIVQVCFGGRDTRKK